ncbi:hypothetical protein EVA_20215 [gut metagenome]|uniref:Uncharacterized protein n=1 Tax=gut metagenome TaxID=749906 RepID=J9FB62_9ZZZZ
MSSSYEGRPPTPKHSIISASFLWSINSRSSWSVPGTIFIRPIFSSKSWKNSGDSVYSGEM